MRILQNNIIFLLFLFISQSVFAAELFRFDRNVAGFVNYSLPQSLMFISPDGKADWVTDTTVTKTVSYNITNPNCIPHDQSTMTMDESQSGMTLAYPFLVGVGWICKIDDETNSIHFVSNFDVPVNAYSIVYAGENSESVYFLMNSKPMQGSGYLHFVSVNKLTLKVSIRIFATNVPGYSGAMLHDNDGVWITSWPGKIYKIPSQKLLNSAQSGAQVNFAQIAQLEFNIINGMSFFMLKNDNSLLYYNSYDEEDYESYMVNLSNKTRTGVSIPCPPVAGYKQGWLLLCDGTSLQTWGM